MDHRKITGPLFHAGCARIVNLWPGSLTPAAAISDHGYRYENRDCAWIQFGPAPEQFSRWIDIALRSSGTMTINAEELQLPHPRMDKRKFVLQPLADIRPELILPNQSKTVAELLAEVHEVGEVVRVRNDW